MASFEKKLRIAIVAPPFGENGGPEIATKNIAESLSELGAEVTLFSPADWKINLPRVNTLTESLWNMPGFSKTTLEERRKKIIESQIKIISYQKNFDIIHLNCQRYASLVAKKLKIPCVLTFHNRIELAEFTELKKLGVYTVALSKAHSKDLPVSSIIMNGLPVKEIVPSYNQGKYFIALGRIAHSKGIDIAIEIAKKAKKRLLIFGHIGISPERQEYFRLIKSMCDENIIYRGELTYKEVFKYLREAEAIIIPSRYSTGKATICPLVAMEAMACGTPVIGTPIDYQSKDFLDSRASCLSNDLSVLVAAAKNTHNFDRNFCRKTAEKLFDRKIMAKKYYELYKKIIKDFKK